MSEKKRSVTEIKRDLGEAIIACILADQRRATLRNEFAQATAIAYAGVVCLIGWNGEGLPPHEVVPLSRHTNSHGSGGITFGMTDETTVWVEMGNEPSVPLGINEQTSVCSQVAMTGTFPTREEAQQWAHETAEFAAAEHRVGLKLKVEVENDPSKHTMH